MEQMTEEQRRELEEKIKNMNPEELKEFQKKQCIFCQIISGAVPAKKIYEDEKVAVVLDINPAAPGHCLVLPKEHYAIMPQIPEDEIQAIFHVVKGVSQACLRALQVEGTTVFIANGMVAGQKAQHFMVHVIPRLENDGIGLKIPEKQISEADMKKIVTVLGGKQEAEFEEKKKEDLEKEKIDELKEALGGEEKEETGEEKETEDKEEKEEPEKDKEEPDEDGKPDLDSIANLLGGK